MHGPARGPRDETRAGRPLRIPATPTAKEQEDVPMTALLDTVDPDGLLEYSVVFTDRSLNHMSGAFGQVMRDNLGHAERGLRCVPCRPSSPVVAPSRWRPSRAKFAGGQDVLVVRNGWFFLPLVADPRCGRLRGRGHGDGRHGPRATTCNPPMPPRPSTRSRPRSARPAPGIVFAPHVETSAGVILPDAYNRSAGRGRA